MNGQFGPMAASPWERSVWCGSLKCVEPAFTLPLLAAGVTPGQVTVNASLAGTGTYAHGPAHFTRMERVAATTAIARMMRSVHLSTERASVQQVCSSVAYVLKLNNELYVYLC
jgi:hypothetical protein